MGIVRIRIKFCFRGLSFFVQIVFFRFLVVRLRFFFYFYQLFYMSIQGDFVRFGSYVRGLFYYQGRFEGGGWLGRGRGVRQLVFGFGLEDRGRALAFIRFLGQRGFRVQESLQILFFVQKRFRESWGVGGRALYTYFGFCFLFLVRVCLDFRFFFEVFFFGDFQGFFFY